MSIYATWQLLTSFNVCILLHSRPHTAAQESDFVVIVSLTFWVCVLLFSNTLEPIPTPWDFYFEILVSLFCLFERDQVCLSICPCKILHVLLMVVLLKCGFLFWRSSRCLAKGDALPNGAAGRKSRRLRATLWESRNVDHRRNMPRLWRRTLPCLRLLFSSVVRRCFSGGTPLHLTLCYF